MTTKITNPSMAERFLQAGQLGSIILGYCSIADLAKLKGVSHRLRALAPVAIHAHLMHKITLELEEVPNYEKVLKMVYPDILEKMPCLVNADHKVLGVLPDSQESQIRSVFRKKAARYHPDMNLGIKNGEDKYKILVNAYHRLLPPPPQEHREE